MILFFKSFRILAKYLPPSQVKSNTFWRCNKSQIPLTIKNRSIQRKAMERSLDPEQVKKSQVLITKRIRTLQKKLKSKGIEYDVQVSIMFYKIILLNYLLNKVFCYFFRYTIQ